MYHLKLSSLPQLPWGHLVGRVRGGSRGERKKGEENSVKSQTFIAKSLCSKCESPLIFTHGIGVCYLQFTEEETEAHRNGGKSQGSPSW